MTVLVTHASRHGSTAGIAERIAETLRSAGVPADCHPVTEVRGVEDYDAVVLGGAAYMFHWLKDATSFAKRHRAALSTKPVWLFSSGPLGTDLVDDEGRDIFQATRPKEFDELEGMLHPRGTQVFFGAWDPTAPPVGIAERFMKHLPASTEGLPTGDFRDWAAIDHWAAEIAAELEARQSV
ncbi:MAG: flavodoxin domain-containing protein [Acidimicrobiia bacterium]